ncbi:hypothetical protein O3G_MSEX014770 [Manduca sexta]|uniref:Uncharacterized protein n=1 Tax=Manduca sexta TaxID=7130 RepID=A0A921ZWF0_MANSE|nr:hypothetical protein O3G_MSEX014770 [Manduca sexta]KAG6464859.1 hypothetical protein O3G_MSEX014770 [Manduca sexta]
MPDWRYNVLSTNEAYIDTESVPRDPLAASYPRRADRTRPPQTCPYTTIFHGGRHHAPYRLPPLPSDSGDPYADAYSVDRSSNLTDTSSFARYEDCRPQLEDILPEGSNHSYCSNKLDNIALQVQKVPYSSSVFYISTKSETTHKDVVQNNNVFLVEGSDSDALSSCTCDSFERCEFDCRDCRPQLEDILPEGSNHSYCSNKLDNIALQVQKVPYSSSVFYISTKSETTHKDVVQNNNVFLVEGSDSDALSSCTCDSFERCEFDCRDFEPFSDTCCCDPLTDGVCSRSPKDVDSPEHFCDRVVEEDGVSTRSDMDGLDLTLFEPAQIDSNECQNETVEENVTAVAAALCGILYALSDTSIGKYYPH